MCVINMYVLLIEGKKWPKSSTSTENICYLIDADLCRQICADDNRMVSMAHNHSIYLIIN